MTCLICCCSVMCVSKYTPSILMVFCLAIVSFCSWICGYAESGVHRLREKKVFVVFCVCTLSLYVLHHVMNLCTCGLSCAQACFGVGAAEM